MSEKRPKGRLFAPDKLKNHTSEVKQKEKKKQRGGRKVEKRKKGMVVGTLRFYDGYLGDSFLAEKKLI